MALFGRFWQLLARFGRLSALNCVKKCRGFGAKAELFLILKTAQPENSPA
jgi:hypothetical protein